MSSNASKKVARAAASGRNVKARRELPLGYYSVIALVVIVGTFLVGYSRYEKQHPSASVAPAVGTKWNVALGFDVCGTNLPNLTSQTAGANGGIYALSDGLIEVAPTSSATAGANATFAKFVSGYKGLTVSANGFTYPGGKSYSSATKCGGKSATYGIYTWNSLLATSPTRVTDPASIHFSNGLIIAVAVVKAGNVPPLPASATNLGATATTTTAASTATTTTAASTTTTAAAVG